MPEGATSKAWTWSGNLLYNAEDKTKENFQIRESNDTTYLFFPWPDGQKIYYYVLKKVAGGEPLPAGKQQNSSSSDINDKVSQLDFNAATIDDVIRIFGEPTKYFWSKQTFTKDNLPSSYIADYSDGFKVVIRNDELSELRFEAPRAEYAGYVFRDKIKVGSSLEEVLEALGRPKETVAGKNELKDGVLYKDIDGKKGCCYYGRADQNVKLFFVDYKVMSLYVMRGDFDKDTDGESFETVQPITSVKAFDDVRWKDMSKLDLNSQNGLITTLKFNQKTVWPATQKMPPGENPEKILADAMNPGLGIRELHKESITGKGVNVAIIDQPLYQDHPEFAGKIAAYHDVGCDSESSMYGPVVVSLLVGTNCGTAPDAKVYYAAVPSGTKDTVYYAKALHWIIKQDKKLPASEKIRVVSVSAAPSQSPFTKNQQMWDQACARAEAAGILVLDHTRQRGFIGACWYDLKNPEDVALCTPNHPGKVKKSYHNLIFVPASPRTTAEEYNKGDFGYQYNGHRGVICWSMPYCAGVLALGWQIQPQLTPQQMKDLLFQSAYTKKDGSKIINPKEFIRLVKKAKPSGKNLKG